MWFTNKYNLQCCLPIFEIKLTLNMDGDGDQNGDFVVVDNPVDYLLRAGKHVLYANYSRN